MSHVLAIILQNYAEALPDGRAGCKTCGKSFKNNHALFVHFTSKHAPENGRYYTKKRNGEIMCLLPIKTVEAQ